MIFWGEGNFAFGETVVMKSSIFAEFWKNNPTLIFCSSLKRYISGFIGCTEMYYPLLESLFTQLLNEPNYISVA